jgi:hypothetical protein
MKLYADTPGRRLVQVIADVFVVCWIGVFVWLGREVANGIGALRAPADGLNSTGTSVRDNMQGAAGNVANVPLVGDALRGPFDALSGTGQSLANVGTSLGDTVDGIARTTGILVAVIPILGMLLVWALFRLRFAVRASAAAKVALMPGSDELLALRALTRQPLRKLAALGPDVASRFRAGDPSAVRALALLELREAGVLVDRGQTPGSGTSSRKRTSPQAEAAPGRGVTRLA